MRLWKSPIFYVGIVLLLAVGAALSVPYVLDWGRYRTAMEDYGRKVTGRQISIDGPIAVRLFPWPRLSIADVKVANVPGATDPYFISAERVEVRVTLSGLLSGEVRVEGMEVVKPVISIERMAAGAWNWRFVAPRSPMVERLLDNAKLDNITLTDGRLRLIDGTRGNIADITKVAAQLSASSIWGPWRISGGGDFRGQTYALNGNTGYWVAASDPFKFAAKLAQQDGTGLVYTFDGQVKEGQVEGLTEVAPALTADGKSDAEGAYRPMKLKARTKIGFNDIVLSDIAIAPRDDRTGANLLTGEARIKLSSVISIDANLVAPKFNLDEMTGPRGKALLREGEALNLASRVLALLPPQVSGGGTLRVKTLIAGGDRIQNMLLKASITGDSLHIDELSADLPGQTRGLFRGTLLAGGKGPELVGDLDGESLDLRGLVLWLWPEKKEQLLAHWSGTRGRLKFKSRVDTRPGKLLLTDSAYQLNDALGSGSLSIEAGKRLTVDLKSTMSIADIDSFVPGGLPLPALGVRTEMLDAATWLPPVTAAADVTLSLQADRLVLNGIEAHGIEVDVVSGEQGLDLRNIKIGDVSGASLEVSGLVKQGNGPPQGVVSGKIAADNPRGLLRLLGFVARGSDPLWLKPLGKTQFDFSGTYKDKAFAFQAEGISGDLNLATHFVLPSSSDWRTASLSGDGEIKSPLSSAIVNLFNLTPVSNPETAGSISFKANGDLQKGLSLDLFASVFDAKLQFQGEAKYGDNGFELSGRSGVSAERPQALFGAAGLVLDDVLLLSVEAETSYKNGELQLAKLQGLTAGAPFGGDLKIDPQMRVSGDLEVNHLGLLDLLSTLYLPWNGKAADAELPFADSLPLGLTGEVWLRPHTLSIAHGYDIPEAQVAISADGPSLSVNAYGKTPDGASVTVEIDGKATPEGRDFTSRVALPIDLSQALKATDGRFAARGILTIDGAFRGAGRSAASVLANLAGSASYKLAGARMEGLAPDGFYARIVAAKTQADVDNAIAGLMTGNGIDIADTAGAATITEGVAAFLPIRIATAAADAVVKPLADIGSRLIDIHIDLQLKQPPGLPPMQISYSGPPGALDRSVEANELQAHLGFEVLKRGVDELEKLQLEQQRIAKEEAETRAQDQARLEAYQAQRRELRQRQRELMVHQRVRELEEAEAAQLAAIAKETGENVIEPPDTTSTIEPRFGTETAPPPSPRAKPKQKSKPKFRPKREAAPAPEPDSPVVLVPAEPQALEPPPPKKRTLLNILGIE